MPNDIKIEGLTHDGRQFSITIPVQYEPYLLALKQQGLLQPLVAVMLDANMTVITKLPDPTPSDAKLSSLDSKQQKLL